MKTITCLMLFFLFIRATPALAQEPSAEDKKALDRTTAAIRDAFGREDIPAILALHHPAIIKYFGGKNVVIGRDELAKGLTETFRATKFEFIDNQVESTVFNGPTAIETSIFTIKTTSKTDGKITISK